MSLRQSAAASLLWFSAVFLLRLYLFVAAEFVLNHILFTCGGARKQVLHPDTPPKKQPNTHTRPSATAVNRNKDVVVAWKHGFQGVAARPCVGLHQCFLSSVSLKAACTSALRRQRRRRADDLLPPLRHQVAEGVPGDTRAGRADRDSNRRFIES